MRFAHRIQRRIAPGAAHNLSTSCVEAQGDGYNAALTGDKAATLGVNCGMSSGRNGVLVQKSTSCAEAKDVDQHNAIAYGFPLGFRPENTRVYKETATTVCNGTRPGFTVGVIRRESLVEDNGMSSGRNGALGHNSTTCAEVETVVLDSIGGQAESARATQTAPTLKSSHYKFPPCVMEQRGGRT